MIKTIKHKDTHVCINRNHIKNRKPNFLTYGIIKKICPGIKNLQR